MRNLLALGLLLAGMAMIVCGNDWGITVLVVGYVICGKSNDGNRI